MVGGKPGRLLGVGTPGGDLRDRRCGCSVSGCQAEQRRKPCFAERRQVDQEIIKLIGPRWREREPQPRGQRLALLRGHRAGRGKLLI